jgi:hypothetical protein
MAQTNGIERFIDLQGKNPLPDAPHVKSVSRFLKTVVLKTPTRKGQQNDAEQFGIEVQNQGKRFRKSFNNQVHVFPVTAQIK